MKKLLTILCLTFFPAFARAAGISLAPPITDSSVIYLSNLFGVVDGVLSGTGSQIMGSMFGVFNAAVLALGGIVVVYTVVVGTMNTAQEGQALGEKWSSIWIPMRSTMGLALLLPKATGYCLMQVFVMWVIVQGVGAADLVWSAALGYLNRGGVIVQQQQSPIAGLTQSGSEIAKAGLNILTGQVCMLGIEKMLTKQREANLDLMSKKAGPCYMAQELKPTPDTNSVVAKFCDNAVPDFISSVNTVEIQGNSATSVLTASMPNFTDAPEPYKGLTGICGTISWNKFALNKDAEEFVGVGSGTVELSRAIAIQQMYSDLAILAQRIISNSPDFGTSTSCPGFVAAGSGGNACFSKVATNQFGVPYLSTSNKPCVSPDKDCKKWGSVPDAETSPIFVGTEFQSAVADYNGIMLPSLNLNSQTKETEKEVITRDPLTGKVTTQIIKGNQDARSAREFIAQAEAKGWIMAGSYYYNLVKMNGSATTDSNSKGGANQVDSNTGLGASLPYDSLSDCLKDQEETGQKICDTSRAGRSCVLCQMVSSSVVYGQQPAVLTSNTYVVGASTPGYFRAIDGLMDGRNVADDQVPTPTFQSTQIATTGKGSSTVNGFVNNSTMISVPGQPGTKAPSFGMSINIVFAPGPFYLKSKSFGCGGLKFFPGGPKPCIGRTVGNIVYNDILRYLFNFLLDTVIQALNSAVLIFLALPLQAIAVVFQYGMQSIQQEGNNPILSLAMMGTTYINTAMEMWLYIINTSLLVGLIPVVGVVIFALIALAMPLLIAWLGVMTSIGFSTAYFVPMLPYMNFLFGSMAWFMAVIEAMAAAPLIALGVTNPEGHEAFGKGESSIMILLNVFLRPALMVIGFIAAISLSYVSVWVINEGFTNAIQFLGGAADKGGPMVTAGSRYDESREGRIDQASYNDKGTSSDNYLQGQSGYVNWASIYAFFFASLMYTSLYMIVVQNAFNLIYQLPDKVLRWIGGGDQAGQETAQWKEEAKKNIEGAGKATDGASSSMQKQLTGYAQQGMGSLKDAAGGAGKATMSG